jgi:tyrosine-protein kinase Etk/Wzc
MVELRREIEKIKQEIVRATTQILEGETLKGVLDPLSELKKNLEESTLLEVEVQSLIAQQTNLQQTLKDYRDRLIEIPGQELELVRLMRDREVNNKIYVRLLEEREQARMREAAEIGNIRLIELAKTPITPTRPRKMLNLLVGFIVGTVIGLLLIFGGEFMRDAPKTQEEVEQLLNLPVLASVPQVKPGVSFSLNGHAQQRMLINHKAVAPLIGDAFSYLWNAVELALPRSASVLMVTSACAAEGKSTVAANLCLLAAQHGKKTILIDGDIRHPSIHTILGLLASPGLTNIVVREVMYSLHEPSGYEPSSGLNGGEAQVSSDTAQESKLEIMPWAWAMHASIRQALQQYPAADRLNILTAGDASIEPHQLWGAPIIEQVISLLKQAADLIVIDSPPVIGIPDACFIARHVDCVLLCVEAAKTNKKVLQRAQKTLANLRAKVLGVVLNKVEPAVLYGGYEYYKYYQRHYSKPGARKRRPSKEHFHIGGES